LIKTQLPQLPALIVRRRGQACPDHPVYDGTALRKRDGRIKSVHATALAAASQNNRA
jgi:hypothetical protein